MGGEGGQSRHYGFHCRALSLPTLCTDPVSCRGLPALLLSVLSPIQSSYSFPPSHPALWLCWLLDGQPVWGYISYSTSPHPRIWVYGRSRARNCLVQQPWLISQTICACPSPTSAVLCPSFRSFDDCCRPGAWACPVPFFSFSLGLVCSPQLRTVSRLVNCSYWTSWKSYRPCKKCKKKI